jgi:RimJ/RimL family protein N-acetyltransferase
MSSVFLPNEPPELSSHRVLLRPLRDHDIDARQALGKDPDIIRRFGGSPSFNEPVPMTREEATSWYESVCADPTPLHWAVVYQARFVGTARLHSIREQDHKARYAVGLLDRSIHGQGLGQEITREVLRYAFGVVGLHRVDLKVLDFNIQAIRCYLSCGFREEGREREAARVGDTWHDDVIMGILAHEFPAL